MTPEMSEIVPFGKYNGRPVAELLQDQNYCEWLTAQSWFTEKYANLNVLILNAGHEPQDTPEHNRLQARFLNSQFRLAVARRFLKAQEEELETSVEGFEIGGWDVAFKAGNTGFLVECKPLLGDDYPSVMREIKARDQRRCSHQAFRELWFKTRLVLLVEQFSSEAIGPDELRTFFETSNIHVVFLDELEVAQ